MIGNITKEDILNAAFIESKENLIFYGGVGDGKTLMGHLGGMELYTG